MADGRFRQWLCVGLLALLGAGCMEIDTNPESSMQLAFRASDHELYYVKSDGGRVLHFSMTITNETDTTQQFYAFAYATNNSVEPPARAVYPPRALANMPRNRKFAVAMPAVGLEKKAAPNESVAFSGALPVPTEWYDGRAIETGSFTTLSIYLYNLTGQRIFYQSWPVD